MEASTLILVLWIIGILFSWWVIKFYKFNFIWYFVMILFGWVGFIGLIMFIIEKLGDLYVKLNNKVDEKV